MSDKQMYLYAHLYCSNARGNTEIGVTESEWEAMSEDEQQEIIGQFMANIVDLWVAPKED
ncbi:DUF7167 family protein [Proteus terrae]|uniref:DUF7167 family protein n=1 Tax=Proteus terrae TaxID=1574161 RepID=UPI00370B848B